VAVTGGVDDGRCRFSHYEFKVSGLTETRADLIKPPVLGESPISAECRLGRTLQFGEWPSVNTFVIGEVLRIHVKNEFWREGGFPIFLAHNLPLQSNPHTHPLTAVQANPHLRPRIGNPDERRGAPTG